MEATSIESIEHLGGDVFQCIIADDHPLFRAALKQAVISFISEHDELESGGDPENCIIEAPTFDDVIIALKKQPQIELVFLDLHMPGNDGLSGILKIRNQFPDVIIVVVSAVEDTKVIARSLEIGASAFVPKSASLETIIESVHHVMNGDTWMPEGLKEAIEATDDSEEQALMKMFNSLTPKQLDVLEMIASGMLNKQIAYDLGLQEITVKQHVSAILKKFGVNNRTQATLIYEKIKQA